MRPQWMLKMSRPAISSTTACTSTVRNTATNLPAMIVPCRVGVVNRRGMVPSRSSVRIVRATLAAPKNMKKIIMPARMEPVTLTSVAGLADLRRALGDLEPGRDAARVGERLGRAGGHHGRGGAAGVPQGDGAGGGRAGAVEVGEHLADDALDDGAADLGGRVLVQLDLARGGGVAAVDDRGEVGGDDDGHLGVAVVDGLARGVRGRRGLRGEDVREVLAGEDLLDGGAGVLAGLGAALVQVRDHDLGRGDVEPAAPAEGEAEQGGQPQRRHQHHDQRRAVAQRAAQVLPGDGEDLAHCLLSESPAGQVQEHHLEVRLGDVDLRDARAGRGRRFEQPRQHLVRVLREQHGLILFDVDLLDAR